jgi:hypothetical protein
MPSIKTLEQSAKLSIKLEKKIDYYFYVDSVRGIITIGLCGEHKFIFKSEEEHSSAILSIYRSDHSYIVVTQNTIHILSCNTQIRVAPTDSQMNVAEDNPQ